MEISEINSRYILDSRGNPAVEADVVLKDGSCGRASVPSGASTGKREAVELRDNDASAFNGLGVQQAIHNIDTDIASRLVGMPAWDQMAIDTAMRELDGTTNKSRLGANSILAVSLAVAKAQAAHDSLPLYKHIAQIASTKKLSLPMPMMNILNGGRHATGSSDIQEFMIIPKKADSMHKAVQIGAEIFHALKRILAELKLPTTVGDEGGFAPPLHNNNEALDLILRAIESAGYSPGVDVVLAIDTAASELEQNGQYVLPIEGRQFASSELIDWYEQLSSKYPIVSIEDGLGQDDWDGWRNLTERLGNRLQLVGDDLLVTNTELLKTAIEQRACNAILIKPNQIGTLTETINAVTMAKANGWNTIISHRSGETEDTTIAHIAVGLGAGQIKTGSLSRTERTAKYNELLRISEDQSLSMA